MIVDCHTHIWDLGQQFAPVVAKRLTGGPYKSPNSYDHLVASKPVDVCFVLGFKSNLLKTQISNDLIAEYCSQHREKMLGFAGVDPTDPDLAEQLDRIRTDLKLPGLVISPVAGGFHPADVRAMRVYEYAQQHHMPLMIHYGPPFGTPAMEFGPPRLLQAVVKDFPDLKIIISQMASPWIDECVALLAEEQNVYADLSGLVAHPWTIYHATMLAQHAHTLEKLFFGSDYPAGTAASAIEALYSMNQLTGGSNLPTIARQKLVNIVERDVLGILGLSLQAVPSESLPINASEDHG